MLNKSDRITLTLPAADADALLVELKSENVDVQKVTALRQAGGDEFATVVLPIALTAVQVAAAFISVYLAAHLSKKAGAEKRSKQAEEPAPTAPKIEIKIGRVHIAQANFTVAGVEEKIGHPLRDD